MSSSQHAHARARREKKLGLSAGKFKEDLEEAWRTVADKYGNDNLACDELREVLSLFGELPQISEEALPLLVHHLDTDGDDRIAFKDFMVRV
jgi:Ca2+-binding EF-hand superfamily protein